MLTLVVLYNILAVVLSLGALELLTRRILPDYASAYFTREITHGHPMYLNTQ